MCNFGDKIFKGGGGGGGVKHEKNAIFLKN